MTVLRLLSLFVLVVSIAIIAGHLIRIVDGVDWKSSLNAILIPFGLIFFYFGKWCFIQPGAREIG
jgi:hypothetical protein